MSIRHRPAARSRYAGPMSGPNRHDGVLLPWLTPIRAAKGPLRRAGVASSFLLHVLGLIGFVFCLFVCDAWFWGDNLREEIGVGLRHDFWLTWLAIGLYVLFVELAFLLLAWMTACWGAGVEVFARSFGRSLSRWYQMTPWLALLWAGFILCVQGWEGIENWYESRYYDARYGDYYNNNTLPMRLITPDRFYLLMQMGFFSTLGLTNLLMLWWIVGTVGVHRDKPAWHASCRWPAACERCGYALAGLADTQDCPECGMPVRESKHSGRGKRDTGSLRLLMRGLLKPASVGAAMLTRQPTKMPLRVLLWGLFFTVLAGPVMMLMIDVSERITPYSFGIVDDFGEAIRFYFVGGLTIGIYAALVGCLLLFGAGTLVGAIVRVMGKRDILPAAGSAACYSAALLPAWVLAQGLQILILNPLSEYLSQVGRYDLVDFFPVLILLLHGGMLLYLTYHIARITKAARYANV